MAQTLASGEYIEAPNNAALNGTAGTYMLWIRTTNALNNSAFLGRHGGSSSSPGCVHIIPGTGAGGTGWSLKSGPSTGVGGPSTTTNVRDGLWHHLAYSFSSQSLGGALKAYCDGVLEGSATATGAWSFGGDTLRIGRDKDGFWGGYAGDVAEVAWWDVELTIDEIKAAMRNPLKVRPGNLKLYIPCWDTPVDLSPSKLTLTLSGGTKGARHPPVVGRFGGAGPAGAVITTPTPAPVPVNFGPSNLTVTYSTSVPALSASHPPVQLSFGQPGAGKLYSSDYVPPTPVWTPRVIFIR